MLFRTLTAALLAAALALPALAQEPKREITHIAGDVWRFQNNFHTTVFVVTSAGVVVTDPINAEAAAWLKAEIARRFAKPVTHLVYSHSHPDHASGGAVFADTATVIAQENAPPEIDGVAPDIRFSERLNFTVGNHTFELTSLGPGHGSDMLAMVIRPENVAFVVDVVSPGRLPYKDFPGADIAGLIEQTRRVEALDFAILAPGHSRLGDKADAVEAREYVEWLRAAVAAELTAGKSVAEIVAGLDTGAYPDWGAYGIWRDLNIQGMARWLKQSGEVP
ncbi:MAG: MBL fold metallo-hydrolase [Proteobacteria bacterium]|nr:MBL fold metallo-hydrolase [Pseudomonadota bacterium]